MGKSRGSRRASVAPPCVTPTGRHARWIAGQAWGMQYSPGITWQEHCPACGAVVEALMPRTGAGQPVHYTARTQ